VEKARKDGVPITANMYCYTAGATGLDACIPPWAQDGGRPALRKRLRDPDLRKKIIEDIRSPKKDWPDFYGEARSPKTILLVWFKSEALKKLQGKALAEVAQMRRKGAIDTMLDLLVEDDSRIETIYSLMSEDNVRKLLEKPWISFGSDEESQSAEGVFLKRMPHPRAYG